MPPTEPGTFREQNRVLLEYVQDLAGFTVTSRASWSQDDFQQVFDLDHTENRAVWGLFHFDNRRDIEDYSAELRLDTPGDLPLRGALGVYWYDQDRENRQRSFPGPGVVFGAGAVDDRFPALDLHRRDQQGRLRQHRLGFRGALDADPGGTVRGGHQGPQRRRAAPARRCRLRVGLDFDSFTPRVTVRFRPTEDLTLYALAAKGNKPGDFNTEFFRSGIAAVAVHAAPQRAAPPPPDPAAARRSLPRRAAGASSRKRSSGPTRWAPRRPGSMAGSRPTWPIYHIDWENQGLFTTVSILQTAGTYLRTTIIRNVGESKVDGLELETSLQVNDQLSLVANYGYTDSRYARGHGPRAGGAHGRRRSSAARRCPTCRATR